jgi:hypothetical protein
MSEVIRQRMMELGGLAPTDGWSPNGTHPKGKVDEHATSAPNGTANGAAAVADASPRLREAVAFD